MIFRAMRLICVFDLPVVKAEDRKKAAKFRKDLIKEGFYMMQESMYCKFCLNLSVVNSMVERVKSISPRNGIIQLFTMTEKQYSSMIIISDHYKDSSFGDERLIIL